MLSFPKWKETPELTREFFSEYAIEAVENITRTHITRTHKKVLQRENKTKWKTGGSSFVSMWGVKKASHKKRMKCVTTLTVYKTEHNSTVWSTKGTIVYQCMLLFPPSLILQCGFNKSIDYKFRLTVPLYCLSLQVKRAFCQLNYGTANRKRTVFFDLHTCFVLTSFRQ